MSIYDEAMHKTARALVDTLHPPCVGCKHLLTSANASSGGGSYATFERGWHLTMYAKCGLAPGYCPVNSKCSARSKAYFIAEEEIKKHPIQRGAVTREIAMSAIENAMTKRKRAIEKKSAGASSLKGTTATMMIEDEWSDLSEEFWNRVPTSGVDGNFSISDYGWKAMAEAGAEMLIPAAPVIPINQPVNVSEEAGSFS